MFSELLVCMWECSGREVYRSHQSEKYQACCRRPDPATPSMTTICLLLTVGNDVVVSLLSCISLRKAESDEVLPASGMGGHDGVGNGSEASRAKKLRRRVLTSMPCSLRATDSTEVKMTLIGTEAPECVAGKEARCGCVWRSVQWEFESPPPRAALC